MVLYHFTYCDNLPFIRQDGELTSAAELLDARGLGGRKSEKRWGKRVLPCGRVLRDQKPLKAGHIYFAPGFQMTDLVALINAHVFFWPRFMPKFAEIYGDNALIRCRLADVEESNPGSAVLYCQRNSGAPGTRGGKKSRRGPDMFEPFDDIRHSRVAEVLFRGRVRLPDNCEFMTPDEWQKKFANL